MQSRNTRRAACVQAGITAAAIEQVLRQGALSANGMPPFTELDDQQLEDIRHFIREQAELGID